MMEIPGWLKGLALIGILFGVASFFGLNRLSYVKIGIGMFVGIIYFSFCGLVWMVAYRKDVGDLTYYLLATATFPYFITVKALDKSGLLDYFYKKINARARKMGVPDAETLMDMKDFDEIDH